MKLLAPFRLGDHELQITGRVLRIILRGDFTEEHARRYAALVDAAIPRGTPYAGLGEISKLGSIQPEARRFLSRWNKDQNFTHGALIGSSRLMRGVLALMIRAMTLIKGAPIPLHFYSDEAAAEASLAQWQKDNKD